MVDKITGRIKMGRKKRKQFPSGKVYLRVTGTGDILYEFPYRTIESRRRIIEIMKRDFKTELFTEKYSISILWD